MALALVAACGSSEGQLVEVKVSGLDRTITQLNVTLRLDGVAATPSRPSKCSDTVGVFEVCEEMNRFGIEVPTGTQNLDVAVDGVGTDKQVLKHGVGGLNLLLGSRSLDVRLDPL